MEFFELSKDKKTLLILGGSLGARRINQLIAEKLTFFSAHNIQLVWQCGKGYYDSYKKHHTDSVKVHAFLNQMDLAYSAADMIISRAGAGSVSELCIVGKPVLFIPSPNVAEDHQTKNAQALVFENAALLVKESNFRKQFRNHIYSTIAE